MTGGSHRRSTYPVEFVGGEFVEVLECRQVDVAVVVGEQLGVGVDLADLGAVVPEPDVRRGERQAEPLLPTTGRPGLVHVGDAAHVVVLDAGEVPDQPRDRIRLWAGTIVAISVVSPSVLARTSSRIRSKLSRRIARAGSVSVALMSPR